MADDTQLYKLDLDSTAFIEKTGQALGSIRELGASGNLDGLLSSLKTATEVLGPIIAVAGALKEAFDLTLEAESIAAINVQFETLTSQAGISANALKSGLDKASAGLASETELLKAANQQIVVMGQNAARLPEIMELARKYTSVFGGDLIDNFNRMSQAMAMGNERMLKHMGILVNTDEAQKKYAKELGVSVTSLSDAAKRQATFNEAIEAGQKSLSAVDPTLKQATDSWAKFKTILKETGETLTSVIGAKLKPVLTETLDDAGAWAKMMGLVISAAFGEGEKKIKAQAFLAAMRGKTEEAKAMLAELKGTSSEGQGVTAGDAALKANGSPVAPKKDAETAKNDLLEHEKILEQMAKMDEAAQKDAIRNAQEITVVNDASAKQREDIEIQYHTAIRLLDEDDKKSTAMKDQEKIQLEQEMAAKLKDINENLKQERAAALDNYLKHSTDVADGIARAFQAAGQKTRSDVMDFGTMGQQVFTSFQNRAVEAFKAMGSGSKNAAAAMGQAIAGMIGDMATQMGEYMMLAAWAEGFNPAEFAAGAALVALGGLLGSLGGGGGSSASASTPSGGGGPVATSGALGNTAQQATQRQGLTVNVQGNLYDADQTRIALMDIVRNASDQTDFKYNLIGGQ